MTKYRFNVCDINAVETRVGAWVAQCDSLLNVFQPYTDPLGNYHRNGKDSYIDFGVKVYPQFTYEKLFMDKEGHNGKEAKGNAKRIRQFGKVGVLGAIYRMSGGGWGNGKASYIDHVVDCPHAKAKRHICKCPKVYDRIRTGLWGFAYGQGVNMEQQDAAMVVSVFRNAYPEICGNGYQGQIKGIWVQLEDAIMDVMAPDAVCTHRRIGPNGCIIIDKLNVENRRPVMRIHLPSGRKLHYMDAYVAMTQMPWEDRETGEPAQRLALHYSQEDENGIWKDVHTHGGKTFENIVQGIARDVLGVKMLEFEKHDIPVVGHIHDEGIGLVIDDPFSPGLPEMVDMMSQEIFWAPGLLLGADGFEGSFYHK